MPVRKNIHTDRALTNISQQFNQPELIMTKVWPVVPVKKDSDEYFEYDNSHMRIDETLWGDRDVANEVDWEVTKKSYVTERHGLKKLVTDKERRNADSPIVTDRDTTENLTEKLMLRREKRLTAILTNAANYPTGHKPTLVLATQWDNYGSATSDPSKDIATGRIQLAKAIGKRPNLLILPLEVFEFLREHPLIVDRVKYTKTGIIDMSDLAALFDIEKILIAGSLESTANEADAVALNFLWGKNAYLGYTTKRASLKSPSWGYHIQSRKMRTDRWRDEERDGDMIRVSYEDVPKLITSAAGYIIQAAIA